MTGLDIASLSLCFVDDPACATMASSSYSICCHGYRTAPGTLELLHLKHALIKTCCCYDKRTLSQALFLVTNVNVFLGPMSSLPKDFNVLAYLNTLPTVKLLNKHYLKFTGNSLIFTSK